MIVPVARVTDIALIALPSLAGLAVIALTALAGHCSAAGGSVLGLSRHSRTSGWIVAMARLSPACRRGRPTVLPAHRDAEREEKQFAFEPVLGANLAEEVQLSRAC